ncbi:hypothetical protein LX36DRAFT_150399 [Colletotrichum falcatum]|nr:hypothetical protein LX36DRAFT_150399 [Colletotrichum falcatum]
MLGRERRFMGSAKTHETCGRSRRKSSRSFGWHRRSHHHRSRRRSRLGRRRSHRRTWGSCEQCDRPHRTINASASQHNETLRFASGSTNLVALGTGGAAAAADVASLGAVAADVTSLTAAVAGLGVLGALGTVTALNSVSKGNTNSCLSRASTYSCGPRLKQTFVSHIVGISTGTKTHCRSCSYAMSVYVM